MMVSESWQVFSGEETLRLRNRLLQSGQLDQLRHISITDNLILRPYYLARLLKTRKSTEFIVVSGSWRKFIKKIKIKARFYSKVSKKPAEESEFCCRERCIRILWSGSKTSGKSETIQP